jgi:hypothetical protein
VTLTAVAMQRPQHTSARRRHTTTEEVMQAAFSVGPLRDYMTRPTEFISASAVQLRPFSGGVEGSLWSVNQRATEAEESPLLRFVTRKRLVKTLQRNSHCRELLLSKD